MRLEQDFDGRTHLFRFAVSVNRDKKPRGSEPVYRIQCCIYYKHATDMPEFKLFAACQTTEKTTHGATYSVLVTFLSDVKQGNKEVLVMHNEKALKALKRVFASDRFEAYKYVVSAWIEMLGWRWTLQHTAW